MVPIVHALLFILPTLPGIAKGEKVVYLNPKKKLGTFINTSVSYELTAYKQVLQLICLYKPSIKPLA